MMNLLHKRDFNLSGMRVLILLCILSMPFSGAANPDRQKELDSLIGLVDETEGTDKIDLLLDISQALWFFNRFEESMNYAMEGLQLAGEINSPSRKADALNRIGNVHYFLRNHEDVISSYNEALKIADSLNDNRRQGIFLNNIGLFYRELYQYDSSEVYLVRALRAKEEYGDKDLISSTLGNLGRLYRDKGRYNLSLEYFVRQLDIQEGERDIRSLTAVHRQTGEIFYLQGRYDEALRHFRYSLAYSSEIGDKSAVALAHYHIAMSLLEMGNYDEALERINTSMELARAISSGMLEANNYHLLYLHNKTINNHKAAYENLLNHNKLKDSIRNHRSASNIRQLEAIFETEKKNRRIDLLQRETRIQELHLNRQNITNIILASLFAVLVIFTIIIALRYRTIMKTNRLLKHKISELEKTNDKLRRSARTLEQLNATKNRFFSIIAHDLKNPFNALLGFSEIIVTNFSNIDQEERKEYIGMIHQSSQNLYKLLENLLKWSAAQTGTMHYLPEKFDLVSLIQSEINFFRISANKKKISLRANIPEALIINSDKLLLSSVIRNLIDNAIKFTNEQGSINISISSSPKDVRVSIDDSGIGIPWEMQKKLFRVDGDNSRKGTGNEEGGGLGLILCKELIEKAGGKIGFYSKPGVGSSFWFNLPIGNGQVSEYSTEYNSKNI